jgi:hypothetical protein
MIYQIWNQNEYLQNHGVINANFLPGIKEKLRVEFSVVFHLKCP